MSIKSKVFAFGAGLTLLGGIAATTGTAQASSPACAFSNGCATLHGTDANGNTVAMDAKRLNKAGIIIGYPDNVGDGATSFDGVLHYGKGAKTTSYADTALQANDLHFACTVTGLIPPITTSATGGTITDGGNQLNVENAGGAGFTVNSGTSLGFTGTLSSTTALDETASSGCTVLYTWDTGTSKFVSVPPAGAGTITESYIGGGVTQFSDSLSTSGGKFSFNTLPAGVATTVDSTHGDLDALTSTAVPGTYSSVGVTYTAADGTSITEAFELVVSGIKSVTPGAGVPYYTFVYAPNGDWTSQCVTDVNGSGALQLIACTLGKDTGQDFSIGSGTNGAPGLLNGSQNHVSNLLAAVGNAANSCLTDPSTSAAGTPQSDAADELAPGGRQLRVNGSCAANTNLWSWGT
jgi:hypothetical protein